MNNVENTVSEEEKPNSCCFSFCTWFFQILVWISIALIIVGSTKNINGMLIGGSISLGLSYLIYIILEFCSPTCKFLNNLKDEETMNEKMAKLFLTPPVINFYAKCYHYISRNKSRRIVVTHTESFDLPYYSSIDVSGLFLLKSNEAQLKKKAYIQLKLKEEINFADTISYSDYLMQKDSFWKKNMFLDIKMDFTEKRFIPEMKEFNLIKIGTKDPKFVGLCWYILSVLITFGEFYKIYLNSCCIFQTFKIRKLISTRYNLLESQYIQQYQPLMPQLNLINEKFNYERQNTGYCNTNIQPDLPTKEQIEESGKYVEQIPNYTTFNNGIVKDIPKFNNPNYNSPPPAYVSFRPEGQLNMNEFNENIPIQNYNINGDFNDIRFNNIPTINDDIIPNAIAIEKK